MKILVLPMGGIGNMLMFTPVLEKLHKCYPKAEITFLMPEDSAKEVLKYCPYIKLIICNLSLKLALSMRKEKFDMCFIPYPSAGIKKIAFAKAAGCKKIISHPYFLPKYVFNKKIRAFLTYNIREGKKHDVESNLDLLRALHAPIEKQDKQMKLWISSSELKFAEKFFKNRGIINPIGIHPGSRQGMSYKRWPIENFNGLIKYLSKKGNSVLVFFGPEEEYLMKDTYKDKNVFFICKLTLHQSAAFIRKCKMFISNDSGLMHVAASQNVPAIGIFGPTPSWKYGPYGLNCHCLKSKSECAPCYFPPNEPNCKSPVCMKSIKLDEVINKVDSLMKNAK